MREHIYIIGLTDDTEIFTNEQSLEKIIGIDRRPNPIVSISKFISGIDVVKYKRDNNVFVNIDNIAVIFDYEKNAEIVKGDENND